MVAHLTHDQRSWHGTCIVKCEVRLKDRDHRRKTAKIALVPGITFAARRNAGDLHVGVEKPWPRFS